jgi:hypothetical protein
MREEEEVFFRPTCRQGISIPSILSSRYLRNGVLTPGDLILAAVITSQPEDQAIAQRVAREILFGREQEEAESQQNLLKNVDLLKNDGGISGGSQLLKDWDRIRRDEEYQRRLRRIANSIVLRSDSICDYNYLTKEDSGPLEGEKLSFFYWGDDPELVDFDESLENLIIQGKELSWARYEDFIIRHKRGQRKAVAILQDISGSMGSALRYSLIFGAILIYVLQKHELAIAFFESDDYIVKRFFDMMPAEKAAAAMISANSMLGTMGGHALTWARKQLSKVDGRYHERECIILSDLGFGDIDEVAGEVKLLKRMGIRVTIILPPAYIYKSALKILTELKCSFIKLDDGGIDELIGEVAKVA